MIPFANDTVTLIHKGKSSWTATVISRCSYRRIRRRSLSGNTAILTDETVCRIPAGGAVPAVGDVIVLGRTNAAVYNEIELVRLLEAHRESGAFRVESVSDNARPGMPIPHYAVRGE